MESRWNSLDALDQWMALIDVDRDRLLSPAEFAAFILATQSEPHDQDDQGTQDHFEEALVMMEHVVARYDTDHDDMLSVAEIHEAFPSLVVDQDPVRARHQATKP